MASSMLFSSCTFTMDVPPEFSRFPKDTTVYTSMFNRASAKKSTLHAPTLRAILAYMKLYQATTAGESVDGLGAIGTQNGKKIIVEVECKGSGEVVTGGCIEYLKGLEGKL